MLSRMPKKFKRWMLVGPLASPSVIGVVAGLTGTEI